MILQVKSGASAYDIVLERGALNRLDEYLPRVGKALIVTDDGVPAAYARAVAAACEESMIVTLPQGERTKNLDNHRYLLSRMLQAGFTRSDRVIAVGGGVMGDLAGFAAAVYMRGIAFYNVPTTLLSQVDSSIGGKVAVDMDGVKNIVGAFYPPKKVVIDSNVLATLPPRQVSAGLAESIDKFKVPKLCYWAFTLVFAVSVRCSPLTVMALPELVIHTIHPASLTEYMHFDELTYDRKDLSQIQAVTEWLTAHLGEGDTAYMIPDDMLYNPGHLRNCMLPEHPLDGKLPDSFSVPGTHTFPMGFFEAKYVITADPFPSTLAPDTELGHRFNAKFIQLRDETHTLAATFDMGNGYTFSIWERVEAPTREEVETYLHVFDAENAQYPEMFSQVTEGWLAAHGL